MSEDMRAECKNICELCGSPHFEFYRKAKSLYSNDYYDLIRCRRCKLVCVSNKLANEDIHNLYKSDENMVSYFKAKEKNDHILFQTLIKELSTVCKFKSGMKLLDIGCGTGTLLRIAKSQGWDVTGIELNGHAVKYAQETSGLNVIQGSLTDDIFPPESFDLITIIQTLEHIPTPMGVLKTLHKILKKEGMIYVEVPNLNSIFVLANRFLKIKDFSCTIDPTAHLFYFTSKTLNEMLESCGFITISIHAGFNKYLLEILIESPILKKLLSLPYRALYKIYNAFDVGMSLSAVAVKR